MHTGCEAGVGKSSGRRRRVVYDVHVVSACMRETGQVWEMERANPDARNVESADVQT
jgi:hypothetical protein